MRNKFAGTCLNCRKPVAAGQGHPHILHRPKRWGVRCLDCVTLGRQLGLRGEALERPYPGQETP